MTRSRILKIKFCVIFTMFLLVQFAICDATYREKRDSESHFSGQSDKSSSNDAEQHPPSKQNSTEKVSAKTDKTPEEKKANSANSTNLTSNGSTETKPANGTVQNTLETVGPVVNGGGHLASINAGALKRGFYVLIGLSVLVIAYFVFRSFRVTKTRAQMIRKYGILAHRQDVEMRPLPLDEDDEDDTTVFDVSNMSKQTSP